MKQKLLSTLITTISLFAFNCGLSSVTIAQETNPPVLKVGTKALEPFVFLESDGNPFGYSIELWDTLAQDLNLDYEWVIFNSVGEVLAAVETGEVDLAIAAFTITANREETLDFSHPYYPTGLQAMVRDYRQRPLLILWSYISSPEALKAIGILLGISIISAHLVWFFERRNNPEMFPKSYLRGIWEALWWSFVTATTVGYGDKSPVGFVGRLVAIFWMFLSLFVVGYFTSSLTAQRLRAASTLQDLYGNPIGAVRETTAAEFVRQQPMKMVPFTSYEQGYQALREGKIQGFVADAPTLRYHTSNNPEFRLLLPLLTQEYYGIVFPQESPLTEPINIHLLQLKEQDWLNSLNQKWFSQPQ
ncbi:transporter substrate-binding domain-containing protein [Roseofilum sp. BLCC_M154]|uniref:Transporter substrate-binding domain-containing protein n=1 Tax=Roseofilum acuticapitatum BLCC-M154 TaxID=3022444 RepID=A0ABT7AU07_9CYAN|nr:transporter substrate-binding domain-containing protein [Roseofilum acuticapitatum]MDJ1169806.1 transporter substrate-binding domain-containing protein [Roseofilum acuticapitatum BLCC-M154]